MEMNDQSHFLLFIFFYNCILNAIFHLGQLKLGVVKVQKSSKALDGSCLMSQGYQVPGTNAWRQKPWSGLVMESNALLPGAGPSQGQGEHFPWGFEGLFPRVFSRARTRAKVSFRHILHWLSNKSSVRKNTSAEKSMSALGIYLTFC